VLCQKRNGLISEEVYQEAKKTYQKVMHEAIKSSWDTFLINARGAEVFRAYGYSK
jgi:predicted RNA-binding protein associated with RNAse of E/G family